MNAAKARVLIVPIGHLGDRAKERPYTSDNLYRINPEHTFLITQHHDPSSDYIDKFRTVVEDVHAEFSKYGEVTVIGAENYFNIFELMSIFRYICDNFPADIFINVGCGSKLTAMAGFLISGWYNHVQCYYPKLSVMRPEIPGTTTVEDRIDQIQMIQSFPVRRLDKELVPVLNLLIDAPLSKKEILEYLQDKEKIDTHFKTKDGKLKERSPQSMYNILKRNYIDPLDERGLIQENSDGEVALTKQGEDMQLIFGKEDFHYQMV